LRRATEPRLLARSSCDRAAGKREVFLSSPH
jgi:hypothetical protein